MASTKEKVDQAASRGDEVVEAAGEAMTVKGAYDDATVAVEECAVQTSSGHSPVKRSRSRTPPNVQDRKRSKRESSAVGDSGRQTGCGKDMNKDKSKSKSTGADGKSATATAAGEADRTFTLARESLVFATECHLAVLQDEDGDTPLHLAVVQAHKHLVHHLVYLVSRSSRKVDIANKLRQTPLHLAVITNQADLVRLLLANNAGVNMPDRLGRTGLHLAAERDYRECSTALLEARDVQLEMRNFDGFTPVHVCVFHNSLNVLRLLLEAGALVSPRDGKSGRTPLHHAAEAGSTNMVQFLLANGADVDATTYAGNTALHAAAGRGHEHIVSLLVTAGADPGLQNTEGDVAAGMQRSRGIPKDVKTGGRHR